MIVGTLAKIRRQYHATRLRDAWWLYLPPIIAQLYEAGGFDVRMEFLVTQPKHLKIAFYPTEPSDNDDDTVLKGRIWVAENQRRGTLRIPHTPEFDVLPRTETGFLSAFDSTPDGPPSLTWEWEIAKT